MGSAEWHNVEGGDYPAAGIIVVAFVYSPRQRVAFAKHVDGRFWEIEDGHRETRKELPNVSHWAPLPG